MTFMVADALPYHKASSLSGRHTTTAWLCCEEKGDAETSKVSAHSPADSRSSLIRLIMDFGLQLSRWIDTTMRIHEPTQTITTA